MTDTALDPITELYSDEILALVDYAIGAGATATPAQLAAIRTIIRAKEDIELAQAFLGIHQVLEISPIDDERLQVCYHD